MDSLKSLIDKQQYELVVKITKNSTEAKDLLYRIVALTSLNKAAEAKECIETNLEKIIKYNFRLALKFHIELLCAMQLFDEAYDRLEYYKNLPYVSQEAEEDLKYYAKYIRKEAILLGRKDEVKEETIIKLLNSNTTLEIVEGFDCLNKKDYEQFVPNILKILTNPDISQCARSYGLMFLVEQKYDSNVNFLSMNRTIELNPSLLTPPFYGKEFEHVFRKIQKEVKDVSLSQTAINILSSYLIYFYPDAPKDDEKTLFLALIKIASEYICNQKLFDFYMNENKEVDIEEVEILVGKIKPSLADSLS